MVIKNFLKLFILLVLVRCSKIQTVEYTRTINDIKIQIEDLTWVEEPLTLDISKPIVENPAYYIDSLILLVRSLEIDIVQKELALVLMKHLSREKTLSLTDSIINNLPENIVNIWISGYYGNKMLKDEKNILFKKYKIN